jgi:hypothetical protein
VAFGFWAFGHAWLHGLLADEEVNRLEKDGDFVTELRSIAEFEPANSESVGRVKAAKANGGCKRAPNQAGGSHAAAYNVSSASAESKLQSGNMWRWESGLI